MLVSASLAYVDAVEGPEGLYLAWNGSVALNAEGLAPGVYVVRSAGPSPQALKVTVAH